MIERKKCINCGAEYKVEHDLPDEDYIEKYCPFCGADTSIEEEDAIFENEEEQDDWN